MSDTSTTLEAALTDAMGDVGGDDEFVAPETVEPDESLDLDAPDGDADESDPSDEPEETTEDDETAEAETDDTEEGDEPPTYTVKVDGEEIEVTLEDLRSGYMRQADYTKKTQALAEERGTFSRLDAALAASPESFEQTVAQLRKAYGHVGDDAENDEVVDPYDRRLAEVERFANEQRMQAAAAAVQAEIDQIKASDPDLDESALVQFAIDNGGLPIRVAYEAYVGRTLRETAAQKAKAAREAKLTAKKTAPKVRGGSKATKVAAGATPDAADLDLEALIRAEFEGR